MAQCAAKTKDGDLCQIPARKGQRYCHIHRRQNLWRFTLSASAVVGILWVALQFFANLTGILSFIGFKSPVHINPEPSFTPSITLFPLTSTNFPTANFTFTLIPSSTTTPTPQPTLTLTSTVTNTPTITHTPTTTPNPIIFRGFDRNCIDPNYWSWHTAPGETAPGKYDNGCWDLSSRGLNSQEGGLRINIKNPLYPIFSVSTKLPEHNLEISFTLDFDSFQSKSSDVAAILVFGIGPESDWVLKNGNYLTFSILQGNITNEILEQIGTNKLKPDARLQQFFSPKKIDVRIVINGIDMTIYLDGVTYSSVFPISLSKPNSRERFWIGYQLPANQSELKATISEFKIVETK